MKKARAYHEHTILLLLIHTSAIACFLTPIVTHSVLFRTRHITRLHSSLPNDDDEATSSSQKARFLLEKSWNENTMGIVPKSPEMAAKAAAHSVEKAMEEGKRILLVDIHMSDYNVLSGEEMYDETLAMQFCVELAKNLGVNIPILLKNEKSKRLVERVLESRSVLSLEKQANESMSAEMPDIEEDKKLPIEVKNFRDQLDSSWNMNRSDKSDTAATSGNGTTDDSESIFYDDFADFGNSVGSVFIDGVTQIEESNKSIDDFVIDENVEGSDDSLTSPSMSVCQNQNSDYINDENVENKASFRIGSLFGDEIVSTGADMFNQAKDATDKVALVDTVNDNIIIVLSSCSNEEMIGVRRLVTKYGESKTIIFVNSKLDPVPREFILKDFVVAYSFMPLIAQNSDNELADPIKIVIMKRFPANWEVYIDAGKALGDDGFQFAETIDDKFCFNEQSPPMQHVTECISRYLDFKNK